MGLIKKQASGTIGPLIFYIIAPPVWHHIDQDMVWSLSQIPNFNDTTCPLPQDPNYNIIRPVLTTLTTYLYTPKNIVVN